MAITNCKCSLSQLENLAAALAHWATPGTCLTLQGEIGTGKTTFSRFFLQSLIPSLIKVPSPTFTLVQTYSSPKGDIWHCDLYRLKSPEDTLELGLDEAIFKAICLIEWPHKMGHYLPLKRLDITFSMTSLDTRNLTIQPVGFQDESLLSALKNFL